MKAFLLFFLAPVLGFASSVTLDYNYPYSNPYGAAGVDTVTCNWPTDQSYHVFIDGADQGTKVGGSTFQVTRTFGNGDLSNAAYNGVSASYTTIIQARDASGNVLAEADFTINMGGDEGNHWQVPAAVNATDSLTVNIQMRHSATVNMAYNNQDTAQHEVTFVYNGQVKDNEWVPANAGSGTFTWTNDSASAGDTWAIFVDGQQWQSGVVSFGSGGDGGGLDYIANAGEYDWSANPTPTPTPSPSPTPTPSASPSPTPSVSPSPNPSSSPTPTPSGGGGGGSSPTPTPGTGGGGDGGSGTGGSGGSGTQGLTEADVETAIRNTFGDTGGAPQADSSDFQPQADYSPPADQITSGLNGAQTYLSSQYGIFSKMVPDLSGFSGLGRQYTFTIDCSGLRLGTAVIDLQPYRTQMEMLRTVILVILSLVLAIKCLKHCGPSL